MTSENKSTLIHTLIILLVVTYTIYEIFIAETQNTSLNQIVILGFIAYLYNKSNVK